MNIANDTAPISHKTIEILGVDPGKTTGIVHMRAVYPLKNHYLPKNIKIIKSFTFHWDNHYSAVNDLLSYPYDYVVCEDFRVYKDKAEDLAGDILYSAQLIGIIRHVRKMFFSELAPVELQMASERKIAKVEKRHKVVENSKHTIDAYQHAKLFALTKLPIRIKKAHQNGKI